MYQGHLSDGSSVQRHSAGSNYPYVVGKQEGRLLPWFVLAPSGFSMPFRTAEKAFTFANAAAKSYNARQGAKK